MTAAPRLHLLLLAALATTLLAPGAAADAGQVTAQKASYRGGAAQAGECVAFFLTDGAEAGTVSEALLSIDIRADRLEALQIERRYLVSPEAGGITQPVEDPRFDKNAPPARTVLEKATATLVAQQPDFQVHVVPTDAAGSVPFTAHADAGAFEPYDAIMMDSGRFESPGPLDEDSRVPNAAEFWAVRIDRPLVVHDDQGSQFRATFTGDFVLEVWGATLQAEEPGKSHTLESGAWTDPAVAGVPLPGELDSRRTVLLRIFLEGASVRVGFQGVTTDAYWASPAVGSSNDGDTTLEGATGQVTSGDEVVLLEDERFVLSPGTLITMTPAAPGMAVGVQPGLSPATTAGSSALGGGPAVVVGIAALLALLVAAGLGLLRRSFPAPDLRQVELALESQRYARAARVAKSILRSRPGLEDAVLGRAIALSRSGRAGAAISEIHEHLATRGASDGSLHYVLGLSFLDMGRVAEARVALGEAVARTPALRADVAARLGHHSESQPMTLREVHGYA